VTAPTSLNKDEADRLLSAALAELAEGCQTPDDVPARLLDAECWGTRGDCYTCPIAVWLRRRLGPEDHPEAVSVNHLYATWAWTTFPHPVAEAAMPAVLQKFVTEFDKARAWPELAVDRDCP
jgi:hypothetical protein